MLALVQALHAVVVHEVDAVPGVHAEAEQVHGAAHVVVGVGQVRGVLVGRRTAAAGGLRNKCTWWACICKRKYVSLT